MGVRSPRHLGHWRGEGNVLVLPCVLKAGLVTAIGLRSPVSQVCVTGERGYQDALLSRGRKQAIRQDYSRMLGGGVSPVCQPCSSSVCRTCLWVSLTVQVAFC